MTKPDSIHEVLRLPPEGGACLMVYSHPGLGKTSLIGTGGKGQLIIRSPTDHTAPIIGSGVEEWEAKAWSDMADAEEFLRHEGDQYRWVWLDCWSLMQDHFLDDVWADTVAKYPHREGGPIDKGEYNLNFVRSAQWLRNVVAIAKTGAFNLGMTAHVAEITDTITGEDKLRPWIQGKNMSSKFMGYMHVVAYLELTAKGSRVIRLNATNEYDAKNQFSVHGAFPGGKLLKPTLPAIEAELDKARAKPAKAGQLRRADERPRRRKSGTRRRKAIA